MRRSYLPNGGPPCSQSLAVFLFKPTSLRSFCMTHSMVFINAQNMGASFVVQFLLKFDNLIKFLVLIVSSNFFGMTAMFH